MTAKQLALTDLETLDKVISCLTENFNIETQGAKAQAKNIESWIHGNGYVQIEQRGAPDNTGHRLYQYTNSIFGGG
jgi:hypothetical protein